MPSRENADLGSEMQPDGGQTAQSTDGNGRPMTFDAKFDCGHHNARNRPHKLGEGCPKCGDGALKSEEAFVLQRTETDRPAEGQR